MSDSKHIERIIRQYFAANTTEKLADVQLASTVKMIGPMLPEPLHGDEAVREYLSQLAPFIDRTEVLEIIIDRNSVAVRTVIFGFGQIEIEGAFFFRIFEGQISRIRSLFDTKKLMAGGKQ